MGETQGMSRFLHRLTDCMLIAAFVVLTGLFAFSPSGPDDGDDNFGLAALEPGIIRLAVRPAGARKTFATEPAAAPQEQSNFSARSDRSLRLPASFSPLLVIPLRT
jgi:hypothetical protein